MLGFDINKAIQSSAYLLRKRGGRLNYMLLLKWLYMADRTSLERRSVPIVGDSPFAMERGPVPGTTLDLIKGNDPASQEWDKYIHKDHYDVILVSDPGNLSLSRAEMRILDGVIDRFDSYDEWEMVKWCHENLPEYQQAWESRGNRNRNRIQFGEVLEAIGLGGKQQSITDAINESVALSRFFGDHIPAI